MFSRIGSLFSRPQETTPSILYTGENSFYVDSESLRGVVSPSPTETFIDFPSITLKKIIELWRDSFLDLNRLGTLILNGKVIYDPEHPLPVPEALGDTGRSIYVFDRIAEATGRNEEVALKIANLLSQATLASYLAETYKSKHHFEAIEAEEIIDFKNPEQIHSIKLTDQNFSVNNRIITAVRRALPQKTTYFQGGVNIEGKISDLKECKVEKLHIAAGYSQEFPAMKTAQKVNLSRLLK